jgi:vancomycin permeability regulator SanA
MMLTLMMTLMMMMMMMMTLMMMMMMMIIMQARWTSWATASPPVAAVTPTPYLRCATGIGGLHRPVRGDPGMHKMLFYML